MIDLIVVYDISMVDAGGERRLARVAAVCERYGQRVQKSVFECRLDDAQLARLIGELGLEIAEVDSVFIYRLGAPAPEVRRALGRAAPHCLGSPWVL